MFDDRLKKLRLARSMSQSEISEQLDIKPRTYISYECNQREPNSEVLKKLALFFGVSADYLLGLPINKNRLRIESEGLRKSGFSDKETRLIKSYRDNPELQPAVDKLLDIVV